MKRLVLGGDPVKRQSTKDQRTREQLLKNLKVQEECVESLTSQNRSLNQDIFLLQEKLGNALVDLEATRGDVKILSTTKTQLILELKDFEKKVLDLEEEHKKYLDTLKQEHQKKVQYLEGVGSGLSRAISVIVSGCTVPVNEK